MLNLFVTDPERTVVAPTSGSDADRTPYQELAARVAAQGATRLSDRDVIKDADQVKAPGSLLLLGGPAVNAASEWAIHGCAEHASIAPDGFTVDGTHYAGPDTALLITCRRPDRPEHVVSLFYGLSPASASKVARLLFFYGWQSYLVFRDGVVVARGDMNPVKDDLEVRFHAR
jgi:hypothetical protein